MRNISIPNSKVGIYTLSISGFLGSEFLKETKSEIQFKLKRRLSIMPLQLWTLHAPEITDEEKSKLDIRSVNLYHPFLLDRTPPLNNNMTNRGMNAEFNHPYVNSFRVFPGQRQELSEGEYGSNLADKLIAFQPSLEAHNIIHQVESHQPDMLCTKTELESLVAALGEKREHLTRYELIIDPANTYIGYVCQLATDRGEELTSKDFDSIKEKAREMTYETVAYSLAKELRNTGMNPTTVHVKNVSLVGLGQKGAPPLQQPGLNEFYLEGLEFAWTNDLTGGDLDWNKVVDMTSQYTNLVYYVEFVGGVSHESIKEQTQSDIGLAKTTKLIAENRQSLEIRTAQFKAVENHINFLVN